MFRYSRCRRSCLVAFVAFLLTCLALNAAYKPRPWKIRSREDYPARLTSEGITIAAEPLFLDTLAGQVFDKNDIVTRGIMPLGVIIFNDNGFAVRPDWNTIEIIEGDDHIHSLTPGEAVHQVFRASKSFLSPGSIPKQTPNPDALSDFDNKWLEKKEIGAHSSGGGFLYLRIPSNDIRGYLSKARVYIPDIYRQDNGARLIFFEIDLKPAIDAAPVK